jgi:hypothetical protein
MGGAELKLAGTKPRTQIGKVPVGQGIGGMQTRPMPSGVMAIFMESSWLRGGTWFDGCKGRLTRIARRRRTRCGDEGTWDGAQWNGASRCGR